MSFGIKRRIVSNLIDGLIPVNRMSNNQEVEDAIPTGAALVGEAAVEETAFDSLTFKEFQDLVYKRLAETSDPAKD